MLPRLLPRHHGGRERSVCGGKLVQDPAGMCKQHAAGTPSGCSACGGAPAPLPPSAACPQRCRCAPALMAWATAPLFPWAQPRAGSCRCPMASVGRWPPGPPGLRGADPARLSTVPGPQRRGVLGAPGPLGVGAGAGRAAGCHALPARRPGCACRAITEMAPISSDCWKPAHELSQRVRRVSHQHAVTTPRGTRHEGCSPVCRGHSTGAGARRWLGAPSLQALGRARCCPVLGQSLQAVAPRWCSALGGSCGLGDRQRWLAATFTPSLGRIHPSPHRRSVTRASITPAPALLVLGCRPVPGGGRAPG